MPGRFAAFSFVDRILEHRPGAPIRGRYAIPAGVDAFPASLAAEAVGQLAAWVAMRRLDFRVRPVAGLAGETRYGRAFGPGDTLELEVDLESATESDVAYHGRASVRGEPVMVLERALGPMLPAAGFDDPAALARDFDTLAGPGAAPGRFTGLPAHAVHVDAATLEPGRRVAARLDVPADAPYFADHFPRKPVYPATLLMDALGRLACTLAGKGASVTSMQDVKVRAFIPPGSMLALSATFESADATDGRVVAKLDGKPAATARVQVKR
jgi:3-hydroxymyristoyl/3-hydroxydecanoyl-(acyl carrier protein) dehydratase